jgi:endonuclease YncB( thermonuclease family)
MAKAKKKKKSYSWDSLFPPRNDTSFWKKWLGTRVERILDGDTLLITRRHRKGKKIAVRMSDYHAPELRDIGGCTAKALLHLVLPEGSRIKIRPSIPNYHRIVCRVMKGGIEVNKILSRTRITAKRNDNHLCPIKLAPKATWGKK